jgi:hypothetical protein
MIYSAKSSVGERVQSLAFADDSDELLLDARSGAVWLWNDECLRQDGVGLT